MSLETMGQLPLRFGCPFIQQSLVYSGFRDPYVEIGLNDLMAFFWKGKTGVTWSVNNAYTYTNVNPGVGTLEYIGTHVGSGLFVPPIFAMSQKNRICQNVNEIISIGGASATFTDAGTETFTPSGGSPVASPYSYTGQGLEIIAPYEFADIYLSQFYPFMVDAFPPAHYYMRAAAGGSGTVGTGDFSTIPSTPPVSTGATFVLNIGSTAMTYPLYPSGSFLSPDWTASFTGGIVCTITDFYP